MPLPFTSAWKSGEVLLPFGGEASFETVLLFPSDDAIRYEPSYSPEQVGGEELVEIGYIYSPSIRAACSPSSPSRRRPQA